MQKNGTALSLFSLAYRSAPTPIPFKIILEKQQHNFIKAIQSRQTPVALSLEGALYLNFPVHRKQQKPKDHWHRGALRRRRIPVAYARKRAERRAGSQTNGPAGPVTR